MRPSPQSKEATHLRVKRWGVSSGNVLIILYLQRCEGCTPVTQAPGMWRQEDHQFQASTALISFIVAMAKHLTKQCVGERADFGFRCSPLRWWSGGRQQQQERGAASWSYHIHEQDTEWEECLLACAWLNFSTLYDLGSPVPGMVPPTAKMGLSISTNGIKIIPQNILRD